MTGTIGGYTLGSLIFDGETASGPAPTPVGITEFRSIGARVGIDPGWSTGGRIGIDRRQSVGSRVGIDPGRSVGSVI